MTSTHRNGKTRQSSATGAEDSSPGGQVLCEKLLELEEGAILGLSCQGDFTGRPGRASSG